MGKAEEAGIYSAQPSMEAPPPAYSESDPFHTAQTHASSSSAPSHTLRQFPPSFSLYSQGAFSATYLLGEHLDQPLYAVRTHTGFSGSPSVVLHSGPSEKDPMLAAAESSGTFSRHSAVILPPLPGAGGESTREPLRNNHSWKTQTYEFSVEVGPGLRRRERFEWRSTHGEEVRQLDKHAWGWKLVRLGHQAAGPGVATTSDGLEVVAVFAENHSWSMTKVLRFQFLGSGLPGELGERWAVMAVMSCLRVWYLIQNSRAANNAVAAS